MCLQEKLEAFQTVPQHSCMCMPACMCGALDLCVSVHNSHAQDKMASGFGMYQLCNFWGSYLTMCKEATENLHGCVD